MNEISPDDLDTKANAWSEYIDTVSQCGLESYLNDSIQLFPSDSPLALDVDQTSTIGFNLQAKLATINQEINKIQTFLSEEEIQDYSKKFEKAGQGLLKGAKSFIEWFHWNLEDSLNHSTDSGWIEQHPYYSDLGPSLEKLHQDLEKYQMLITRQRRYTQQCQTLNALPKKGHSDILFSSSDLRDIITKLTEDMEKLDRAFEKDINPISRKCLD